MILYEQEYIRHLHKVGVGENDKFGSSINSYISYLRSVSKILIMNISPETVVNEEDIENIFQRLHGKIMQPFFCKIGLVTFWCL